MTPPKTAPALMPTLSPEQDPSLALQSPQPRTQNEAINQQGAAMTPEEAKRIIEMDWMKVPMQFIRDLIEVTGLDTLEEIKHVVEKTIEVDQKACEMNRLKT